MYNKSSREKRNGNVYLVARAMTSDELCAESTRSVIVRINRLFNAFLAGRILRAAEKQDDGQYSIDLGYETVIDGNKISEERLENFRHMEFSRYRYVTRI